MDVEKLTIKSARQLLDDKKISVKELTEASLKRARDLNDKLNSFVLIDEEGALKAAEQAQEVLDRGDGGPLTGIPMAHKDMFCTAGIETTACSNILKSYIPPYDATVVARLKKSGAVSLGKLNCDAFAHGASTENSDFGPSRNPYDTDYVPGGSSGGSAVAVSSGAVLFSTGTDTGGSIRQPASFNNVVGLKPTYGRVPRTGVIAMASSTDCPGPIAKNVEDTALVLAAMAGADRKDATSSSLPVQNYLESLTTDLKGLKIGVPNEFFEEGLDPKVEDLIRKAISQLEELGATVEGVSLPHVSYSLATYYIVMPSELSSNLSRYDGIKYGYSVERKKGYKAQNLQAVYEHSRSQGFGLEAKRRILLGTYALSAGYYDAYYKKAQQVRVLLRQDFDRVFQKYDAIVGPVTPTPPFKIGEKSSDPLAMYLSDVYTTPMNMVGNPALSVPCGFVGKLPVGLQISTRHFDEATALRIGYAYQQATKFYEKSPKL